MSPLNDKQVKCMWKYRVMQTYDKHKVYEAVKVGRGPAGCNKLMHVHYLLLWLSWEGVKILNAFCKWHVHGAQKRHQIFSITHIDTFVDFQEIGRWFINMSLMMRYIFKIKNYINFYLYFYIYQYLYCSNNLKILKGTIHWYLTRCTYFAFKVTFYRYSLWMQVFISYIVLMIKW